MSEVNNAVTPAKTAAVATAQKPSAPVKGAMAVAPKGQVRRECEIITRLKDKDGAESLFNIILQLTGGDKLFVEKFAQCCKAQVDRHWKYDPNTKKWTNPFLVIPLNAQLDALYRCASKKILPDGYNCNLIPYLGRDEKRVDVSIDYKGLIDTEVKEGIIVDCDAKEVCEGDIFEWSLGEVVRWTFDPRKARGEVCGYCAWAVLPNGKKKWQYMSVEEIADVRKCARTQNIWNKWLGEMSKKTVIRRLFKTLPNTPRLQAMLELDNGNFIDMSETADGKYAVRRPPAAAVVKQSPVRQVVGAPAAQLPAPEAEQTPEAEAAPEVVEAEPEPVFA